MFNVSAFFSNYIIYDIIFSIFSFPLCCLVPKEKALSILCSPFQAGRRVMAVTSGLIYW